MSRRQSPVSTTVPPTSRQATSTSSSRESHDQVGMTRRLDPRDPHPRTVRRVGPLQLRRPCPVLLGRRRRPGGKCTPDSRGSESTLVNNRSDFFTATPVEVRDLVLKPTVSQLAFAERPEALEYHQSEPERSHWHGGRTWATGTVNTRPQSRDPRYSYIAGLMPTSCGWRDSL
jgi:hypothetical protein